LHASSEKKIVLLVSEPLGTTEVSVSVQVYGVVAK
jgi:hypothetical protein